MYEKLHTLLKYRRILLASLARVVKRDRDTAHAEKERRVALAPAEKDYPCILLTLVIIYLSHYFCAALVLSYQALLRGSL